MEKNKSSINSDVNGIYSVSDFLNYMSDQVSWSNSGSFGHLKVFFWSQDHLIELKKKGAEPIKEKIKSALEFLDFSYIPTLVQFWAPRPGGSQQFLETFDLPFGISVLRKGLCWYGKKCLNYKYNIDGESDEEDYGPVGRVFRNGFPEFSPDVSLYSADEYKLRDSAITCGIKGYLALPVFESAGQQCIGVLELVSIWDGSYCLTDKIGKVDKALKTVGFRSLEICSPFDMDRSSQHEFALTQIKKVLREACHEHKLPFAQAWFKEKKCSGDFLWTNPKGSFVLAKSVSSFHRESFRFCLKKGQSVVWRAFTSGTSCFCRDIRQLRITEYSLVNVARKFDFSSCFAICLQSPDAGSDIYVLEFFTPAIKIREPQAFLSSLLATLKKNSQGFKVASAQKQGEEFSVEVIEIHRNKEVDSFKIFSTPRSPLVSQDQVQKVKSFDSESNRRNCLAKERNTTQIKIFRSHSGKELGSAAGKNHRLSSDSASFHPRLKDFNKRKADDGVKVPPHKRKANLPLPKQEHLQGVKNHNLEPVCSAKDCINPSAHAAPQAKVTQIDSLMMIKASYEGNIIKFQLSLTSGIRDFQNEVEKRLELKPGSYKIKQLNDENGKISIASDADLQNFMKTMSLKKTTAKLLLEPVKFQDMESCSNTVASPSPPTAEIQEKTPMFIKVTHNDDTIKFQLSLSAGLKQFKHEVMKRLKLNGKSFGIKYLGEENKWIPIVNDTDLQSYMSNMRLKAATTVRFSLDPLTS